MCHYILFHDQLIVHFMSRSYFLEKGVAGKKERNIDGCLLVHIPTGDQTHNLGMCLDQESNPWPFDLWDDALTSWATQSMVTFNLCISWWAFGLFPLFGFYEYLCTSFWVNICFQFCWDIYLVVELLDHMITVIFFHRGCIILCSYQQWMRAPVSSWYCQHLLSIFKVLTILISFLGLL